MKNKVKYIFKNIPVGIILPVLLTIGFFVFTVFYFLLPYLENALMDKKREMIHELVSTVYNTFEDLEQRVKADEMTREEAQDLALRQVRALRYGKHNENAFWVQDRQPIMLFHPYLELNGADVSRVMEPIPGGRPIFLQVVDLVDSFGEGYMDYIWDSPMNPDYVVPMLSYVKVFSPWGWIVGTGISFEDVFFEVSAITQRLKLTIGIILFLIMSFLGYNVWTGVLSEIQKTKAKKGLQESEERYRALIENVPVGIYRNDLDPLAAFFMVNPALLEMLAVPLGAGAEVKMSDFFVHPEEAEAFRGTLLEKGHIDALEVQFKTLKGKVIWVLLNAQLVNEPNGTVYFDGMIENITERKKAAQVLKESYEKLQKLDKEKDEFIAIASHEMRTPMGIINGYISLLLGKMGAGISEKQLLLLGKVQKNVKRLLTLVNGMLDIEKIEAGTAGVVEMEPVDICVLLASMVSEFQVTADPKKIKLLFVSPDVKPIVVANKEQIRQVVTNLVGNAIKFTPEGGSVSLLVKPYEKDEAFTRVSVKDNGRGIPKEEQGLIFEKFHQVEDHLVHTEEGSGLGLAICKKIVEESFGGQIWVESYNGSGSEFVFILKNQSKS